MTVPKGPIVHRTSAEKVLLKLDEIQHSVVQLQFRVRWHKTTIESNIMSIGEILAMIFLLYRIIHHCIKPTVPICCQW